jgi:D-arabinose 1-dehydrogenase-like Zn-dependent alcohol dehydrogenase
VRAVVYSGYGIMPEPAQVADPACPPDGVVIAVGASGVCPAGDAQVCPRQTQPGFTGPGSFAELVAIHAADGRGGG